MKKIELSDVANLIDQNADINGIVFHGKEFVRVVRCKDCEFYTEEERWCRRLGLCGAFDPNDYCSHGERREDAK